MSKMISLVLPQYSQRKNIFVIAVIFFILCSLISCSSREERSIISQIKKNNFVDLSIYCKEFDKIIIFEEGYYYDVHENEWIGPKIYYLEKGNVKKVINLHCVPADVPYGTIIQFYPFNDGKITLSRENTVFYLTHILEYKTGKIFQLGSQKTDIQTLAFK